jgi:hypothetical protein
VPSSTSQRISTLGPRHGSSVDLEWSARSAPTRGTGGFERASAHRDISRLAVLDDEAEEEGNEKADRNGGCDGERAAAYPAKLIARGSGEKLEGPGEFAHGWLR